MTQATRERAVLRLRLAAVALGATLLLLGPGGERSWGGLALIAYTIGVLLLRYAVARSPDGPLGSAGVVLDVLYASALVSSLPLAAPAWALYAFAIATAAYRFGAWGAIASTAGAIAAYDVVLAVRGSETAATDLWPIQVLIAIGLLCTELVLLATHNARERAELTQYSFAQHDLASAREIDELLSRLVIHAVLALNASHAAVRVRNADDTVSLIHARGDETDAHEPDLVLELDERRALVARIPASSSERTRALLRDLAIEARWLIATLAERDRQRRALDIGGREANAIRAIAAETEQPAIAAQMVMSANALGGRSTLIRRADGSLVAGDPLPDETALRIRDLKLPAVLPVADASGRRVAVFSAGSGLALIAAFPAGDLDDPVIAALGSIGALGGAALGGATERDKLEEERRELLALSERLRSDLRARDDAVASTVHELRTPLTSVSAYGQLIARQLQSALQQLAQIDRLIGDLRSDATMGLALTEVNVATEASEAVRRQRVLNRADVDLRIGPGAPFVVRADAGRLAQVLDNVLGNAVKFSPPDGRIDLSVDRADGEVVISISDEGPGLAAEDLEHVFERYYRARTTSARVPGLGIGLAVSREIVQAHGGRIWAESPGEGRGSTFKISLPTVTADVSATLR